MESHQFLGISYDYQDLFGLCGVFLAIFSYARVQWRRDFAKTLDYSLLNFCSSLLMVASLMHHWNLPSFVSNTCWGIISLYGIYRCLKYVVRDRLTAKQKLNKGS